MGRREEATAGAETEQPLMAGAQYHQKQNIGGGDQLWGEGVGSHGTAGGWDQAPNNDGCPIPAKMAHMGESEQQKQRGG